MVTAKLNGSDPRGYLAPVMEHLPSAKIVELDTLLPWYFTTQSQPDVAIT